MGSSVYVWAQSTRGTIGAAILNIGGVYSSNLSLLFHFLVRYASLRHWTHLHELDICSFQASRWHCELPGYFNTFCRKNAIYLRICAPLHQIATWQCWFNALGTARSMSAVIHFLLWTSSDLFIEARDAQQVEKGLWITLLSNWTLPELPQVLKMANNVVKNYPVLAMLSCSQC